MQKIVKFPGIILFHSFSLFPEYFISISIIYLLIISVLLIYNIYGLFIQKVISNCIALILLMACYLIINDDIITLNFLIFNSSIINDYFAFFTKFLICFFSAIYFFSTADFLKEQKLTSFEYLLIILFAVLGFMLLCSSNDLLIAYLAIELSSLACYFLSSFKKTSIYSIESGLKYFIIGAISSAFFLFGSSFIYLLAGSINLSDLFDLFESPFKEFPYLYVDFGENFLDLFDAIWWSMHLESLEFFNYNFVELGLSLILISLFIKLALAPFHLWSLDVYEGSPTNSTIFFAVITKLSIFVLLIRLCYVSFFNIYSSWQFYSLWIGIFSIFVGSFGGLKQKKLKTLLAYSSVSHMGYVLIAFGTSTYLGIQMLLLYMIIYMISGLCVWFILLFIKLKQKSLDKYNKELGDLVLLQKSNLSLALAFSLTMFSISGIPPMIGFLAKFSVFLSIIGISFYFISFISILLSVVSTFYYVRIIKILYFENLLVGKLYRPVNNTKTILICLLNFLLIFLFINPTIIYLLNDKVILTLLY